MWPIIYDKLALGQAQDPLERVSFDTPNPMSGSTMPDPGLGVVGSYGAGFFQGRRYLSPTNQRVPVARDLSSGVLVDRWTPGIGDRIPDS